MHFYCEGELSTRYGLYGVLGCKIYVYDLHEHVKSRKFESGFTVKARFAAIICYTFKVSSMYDGV